MTPADLKRLQIAHQAVSEAHSELSECYGMAIAAIGNSFESPGTFVKPTKGKTTFHVETLSRAPSPESGSPELSKLDRKILVSLAQLGRPASVVTVGIVGEFSHRSSTVDTALAKLKRQGFVDGSKGSLRVTAAGREAIGSYPDLPRGYELFEYWKNKLASPAGKILQALLHNNLSLEQVAEHQGFSPRSSTVDTAIALLKRLGFIEGSKSALKLTDEFKRAIEPGIRVFDRSNGNETLVDPRGHARR